ncbi:MAG: FxLYD domain-containing protein [Haloarculaceae archaeon]
MNRRPYLTGTATVLAGTGLAGCADDTGSSEDGGEDGGSEPTLEILSHQLYTDESGRPAGVTGTVRNATDSELEFAQVGAVFFDADGNVVDEGLHDTGLAWLPVTAGRSIVRIPGTRPIGSTITKTRPPPLPESSRFGGCEVEATTTA